MKKLLFVLVVIAGTPVFADDIKGGDASEQPLPACVIGKTYDGGPVSFFKEFMKLLKRINKKAESKK